MYDPAHRNLFSTLHAYLSCQSRKVSSTVISDSAEMSLLMTLLGS